MASAERPGRQGMQGVLTLVAVLTFTSAPAAIPHRSADGAAFRDVAQEAGLGSWSSRWGGTRHKDFIVEVVGGGAALLDLDADGILDVYLTTGQADPVAVVPGRPAGSAPADASETTARTNALFRGLGSGRFTPAPVRSGARLSGWYHGVAAADFDDDGFLDLYVTGFGDNVLLRNRGDGSFEDVTGPAGVAFPGFSTGAAWADFDRDGILDLAVTNYLRFDVDAPPLPGSRPTCTWKEISVSCGPRGLEHERAVLFHGTERGVFEHSQDDMFGRARYYGFGTSWSDFDADGWPDLYIADDQTDNRLYRNEAGTLHEGGLLSGTALNEDGRAEGGMGADWADVDGDGKLDLFVTNFADETNTLYRQIAPGLFADDTAFAGLAIPSFRYVGWGVGFRDFDSDGDPDVFIANGHVYPEVDAHHLADRYRQRDELFLNAGGTFQRYPEVEGDALQVPASSRGAAFGDFDRDGDIDVLVNVMDGRPRLLENHLPQGRWIRVRVHGGPRNRYAVGARVQVTADGRPVQIAELHAGHSYLSQSDYELHFGLGSATTAKVTVWWPSGPVGAHSDPVEVPSGHIGLIDASGRSRVVAFR